MMPQGPVYNIGHYPFLFQAMGQAELGNRTRYMKNVNLQV